MDSNEAKKYIMTVVSGEATKTVSNANGRRLVSIYVEPANDDTVYDFNYTDKNNTVINLLKGDYRERLLTSGFPIHTYGNFTLSLANVGNDEDFVIT